MPLRNPVYLDLESLVSQAQYAGVPVPLGEDVVEKESRKRSLDGSASIGPVRGGGSLGRDVEVQTSYRLEPKVKAIVSTIIDGLIASENVVRSPCGLSEAALSKDQLVEVSGDCRLTPASMVGKMLHLLLRTINASAQGMKDLDFESLEPELLEQFKVIYFGNELLPIPVLLEMTGTGFESRVFISIAPNHFVGSAGIGRVEGEVTALATVSALVGDGSAMTTERWLLDGYDWLLRRVMMTNIDDVIQQAVEQFGVTFLPDEARHVIAGPAVVLDVIAVY